jgi:Family of unknown function (DUF6272)
LVGNVLEKPPKTFQDIVGKLEVNMNIVDLYQVRLSFDQQQIMLAFNGPVTQSLIEELGNALKSHLEREAVSHSAAMDVFAVYIEMIQNVRHYAVEKQLSEVDASAVVVIGKTETGAYFVSAGNTVQIGDGAMLDEKIKSLSHLDKTQLKAAYKEQMRRPRDETASTGAGLGLIDMARKASHPIESALRDLGNGHGFFSLYVVI